MQFRALQRMGLKVRALGFNLTAANMAEIDRICPPGAVGGARYDERSLAKSNL